MNGSIKERGRPLFRLLFTVHCSLFTLLLSACDPTLPPLRGQMEAATDPYAVFVGGSGRNSDLYAVRPDGGRPIAITFTNVAELKPALSPDGAALVFLRGTSLSDSTPATVWVMNLLSGSERELRLPQDAGQPQRVAWGPDGASVIVAAERGVYLMNSPPAPVVPRAVKSHERTAAESSLSVLLGRPVFARIVPCRRPADLCVSGDSGAALLARDARDPLRWGDDSVAFFVGDELEIRPLARGRPRRLTWSNPPERPREMTYFSGKRER